MNRFLSNYLFFYPATLLKGEPIPFLIGSYRSMQWQSKEEINCYQRRKFKEILEFSYKNSEFHKNRLRDAGLKLEEIRRLNSFDTLPTMSKFDLIDQLPSIRSKKLGLLSVSKTTGGSTGEPVKLFKNPMALARERCATARAYEWANLRMGDPQLRFWGVPHSELLSNRAKLVDLISNRKRISAFDITEKSLEEYYQNALRFKPRYIYGYVSAISEFADFIISRGYDPIHSLRSVITTSEILTGSARKIIEDAFKVKVFNEYGCGEVGSIAHECPAGNMHIMAENLFVEVDEGGELIVTDFFNKLTPVIRYRLGDFGVVSDRICECGRGLPIIEQIHGRAYDMIKLAGGKKVHPESVIYVFESLQSSSNQFKKFQVVQESEDKMTVNVIPNNNWTENVGQKLIENLRRCIGNNVSFNLKLVETLERERSGKTRVVKSEI